MSASKFPKDSPPVAFISYSTADQAVADAMCHYLESGNIRCWMAPRDILPGQEYAAAIVKALEDVQVFIVVCSLNSVKSQWVHGETNLAVSAKKIIIPFRIDNCSLDGTGMKLYLNDRHWIEAASFPNRFFSVLSESVKSAISLPPGPDPGIKPKKNFWYKFFAFLVCLLVVALFFLVRSKRNKYEKWQELHKAAECIQKNQSDLSAVWKLILVFEEKFPPEQYRDEEVADDVNAVIEVKKELCNKINTEVKAVLKTASELRPPDDGNQLLWKRYGDTCVEYKEKLELYLWFSPLKLKIAVECEKLQRKISQIDEQIFCIIQQKEKSYKNEPSEKNYQELLNALAIFNLWAAKSSRTAAAVERIKQESCAYREIGRCFRQFRDRPNQDNWKALRKKVFTGQDGRQPVDYPGYPSAYFTAAAKIRPYADGEEHITVSLVSWDFRNSRFSKKGINDCQVLVYYGDPLPWWWWPRHYAELRCLGGTADAWNRDGQCGNNHPQQKIETEIPTKISGIKFANVKGINIESDMKTLDIFTILFRAADYGKCTLAFHDGPAMVQLEFSGLPVLDLTFLQSEL